MMDARTDVLGLQDITRIWASFHFLPRDLNAQREKKCSKRYLNKYRMICGPNSNLIVKTIELAKNKSLQHVGIAMHIMADTWAHTNFAGTPSLVINNADEHFFEILDDPNTPERKIKFRHNPTAPDDLEKGLYTNSLYQSNENSIMNLGHGRAGHLPDYSFMKYKYLPAWGNYEELIKDNPSDYRKAFCQMIYAMKFLRGDVTSFEKETYDTEAISEYEDRIKEILTKRQLNACADWKAFGEELSGETIDDYDLQKYKEEYISASKEDKKETFIGRFTEGAIAQKSMVTNQIFKTGNLLAGMSKEIAITGGLI